MPMNYQFDARQFDPTQGTPPHPPGNHIDFVIKHTSIVPTKDNSGGFFQVDLLSQQGEAAFRFNLWNNNEKAVEIAHKQLSALCHVVGIYNLDFNNDGAVLRNARLKADVVPDPSERYPNQTKVSKFYDANGNEPNRAGSGPAPAQQMAAPPNPPPAPPPQQQPAPGPAWAGQPQQPAPAAPQQPSAPAWAPNAGAPAADGKPPWAK